MEAILLGTGTSQGVPVIGCNCETCRSLDFRDKRLRTSLYIDTGNNKIVVDTGPDFRQQMLNNRLDDVDMILFTHQHRDHTAGLDDIRPINFLKEKSVPVYGEKMVLNQIKSEFSYAFEENAYPGVPKLSVHEIENKPFYLGKDYVIPIRAYHHKLPVLGFRFGNFSYLTDASYIEHEELKKLYGSETLILNALRHEDHVSHFNLDEALDIVNQIQPKQAYFVHMSHDMGRQKVVEKKLPEGVNLAYDGLKISINS